MLRFAHPIRAVIACAGGLALALAGGVGVLPASADTLPPIPATLPTVSSDGLPTVQIDGVAWQQVVVGNTVYVAGSFSTARPAGAAAGVGTVPRANLLAYDIRTGELISSWAPSLNAQALAIAASPDGSRIYVGGDFTSVNGLSVWRIAAVDAKTGALITSFVPKPDAKVRAIVASGTTVYFGGLFNSVGAEPRARLAAVSASNGALLAWAPSASGASGVTSMVISPDASRVVVGGSFTALNGSSSPGYGLGAVDAISGALLPFAANAVVRDAGIRSSITSLSFDADSVYGTGYVWGQGLGGNLEGTFRAAWDGTLQWVSDCHGDSYSVYPMGDVIYQANHEHYCGNIGGFPQTNPWSVHHATALTKAVAGVITRNGIGSYFNFEGNPCPALLDWFPDLDTGTYTGQGQAGWSVAGNSQYLAFGGEFLHANNDYGVSQQGLVRYAVVSIAPNKQGPVLTGGKIDLTGSSVQPGTARLRWTANWDRDNTRLTYALVRNSDAAHPVYAATQDSTFWLRPGMGFVDRNVVAGTTYRYRLTVTDPWGNAVRSDTVSVTAGAAQPSAYPDHVIADRPTTFWRLGEPGGPTVVDWAGWNDAVVTGAVTRGEAGAILGDTDTATTLPGASGNYVSMQVLQAPQDTFTLESWIRTTTTSGGRIIGFGDSVTTTSIVADRHVYMDNSGRLWFGVYPSFGVVYTVNSPARYNDGAWHHVVAELGSGGMALFVDGARVAQRTDATAGRPFWGVWRLGGDNLGGWPSQPRSSDFAGTIDDVAIYPTVLNAAQVANHYVASGRGGGNQAPTAAFTASAADLVASVDGSGSSDPDGTIASYAWDFGDGATGSGATASHAYAAAGTYQVTLTVRDNDGAVAAVQQAVTVTAPVVNGVLAADAFGRSSTGGWGIADTGGPWSLTGATSGGSVANGAGRMAVGRAGSGLTAYLGQVSATDTDVAVTVSSDKVANGAGEFVSVLGRRTAAGDDYRAKVRVAPDGSVLAYLTRVSAGAEATLASGTVAGLRYAAGDQFRVRVQVTGTSPTTVRMKVWRVGATEPTAWQLATTDGAAALQVPGAVGVVTYLSGSSTNLPVTFGFDDFVAATPAG